MGDRGEPAPRRPERAGARRAHRRVGADHGGKRNGASCAETLVAWSRWRGASNRRHQRRRARTRHRPHRGAAGDGERPQSAWHEAARRSQAPPIIAPRMEPGEEGAGLPQLRHGPHDGRHEVWGRGVGRLHVARADGLEEARTRDRLAGLHRPRGGRSSSKVGWFPRTRAAKGGDG